MVYDLNYVVNSVLADLELPQGRHYIRYLKWANDGFRKMNLAGLMPTIKTKRIAVDKTTNTVALPSDYIEYTKIGLCCGGVILNYSMNKDMCLPEDKANFCDCDSEAISCAIGECNNGYYASPFGWNYYGYAGVGYGTGNAGFPMPLYGLGAGFQYGTFRINTQNGTIQLDSCVTAGEVILEYYSTGLGDDGNCTISQSAIPPLTAFVHWQRALNSIAVQDRQMATQRQRLWESEVRSYVRRKESMNKSEWMQLIRKYTYQTVKR